MRTSPNIEEVWLGDISVHLTELVSNPWPHLKRLFINQSVHWDLGHESTFRISEEIEELYVLCGPDDCRSLLELPYLGGDRAFVVPKKLRKLYLSPHEEGDAWPAYLERWVRPGLQSGSLKELGLRRVPKPLLDWTKSDQLKFLSFSGLRSGLGANRFVMDEAFSDILDRFPNIEGLDIGNEMITNAALGKAIKKGIKTIYHIGSYHERDEIRDWAREYDAYIIHADYIKTLPINMEPVINSPPPN
jgi:hypothetical protein